MSFGASLAKTIRSKLMQHNQVQEWALSNSKGLQLQVWPPKFHKNYTGNDVNPLETFVCRDPSGFDRISMEYDIWIKGNYIWYGNLIGFIQGTPTWKANQVWPGQSFPQNFNETLLLAFHVQCFHTDWAKTHLENFKQGTSFAANLPLHHPSRK